MPTSIAGFTRRPYRWGMAGAVVAFLIVACEPAGFRSLLTTTSPSSMEGVFRRVGVGMAREEAAKVLDSYAGPIDSGYTSGTFKDGRRFSQIGFDGLPAVEETAQCTLSLMDEYGEGVEVVVGANGRVIAKRYSSDVFLDEWRVAVRGYVNRSSRRPSQ